MNISDTNKKKVLVIGASGFIGYYLVKELLSNGYEVIATGRRVSALKYFKEKCIKYYELDITKKDDFNQLYPNNIEAVFLLAALLPGNTIKDDPYQYTDINIIGTLNTLEYCKKHNIHKLISTTSYADIKDFWKKDFPLNEETPRSFILDDDHTNYIITKNAATDFILHYSKKYKMDGIILRLPPVYGAGPHSEIYLNGRLYKSGFQVFMEKAINGEIIEILGDKDVSRDIVSVKDVVSAMLSVLRINGYSGIYNLSSGVAVTLEEQVKCIIDVFSNPKKKSEVRYKPEIKNNSKSYLLDISKIENDFGYKPMYRNFKDIVLEYKKELDELQIDSFFDDRKKW
jgi:UDP-glucose 4-epimerase